ncbi:hypothetical protein [Listeria booriae]|uniref:hypothetical protein n=1 Tax=Listeria booriae TaxID=1552123 RepID=UPI001E3773CE|nr:hypothetical protein [Listeria booriae]MCD2208579.1 hypothetical protein [Listeria booriae]
MAQVTGNTSNIEMKNLLNDVLLYAFPKDSHPIEKLQQFYVEYQRKEGKKNGDYQADFHRIRIFNLSRDSRSILLSSLHDLAHHIEVTFYGETAHKERFYMYYHNLLVTAMGMNILNKSDLILLDEKEKEKLEKYHEMVRYWQIPKIAYKEDTFYLDVRNGYPFRKLLREWGYKYLPLEELWRGEFNKDSVWQEKAELIDYGVPEKEILVYHATDIQMSFVYYLVIRNAFDHRATLSKLGYRYGAYNLGKRNWVKKIPAHKLEEEKEKVEGLMGVAVKVLKELPKSNE